MIKVNFKRKRILGIFLAAAIVASIIGTYQLQAAGWIDEKANVIITAKVASDDTSVFATEYQGEVNVDLYKIANINEFGIVSSGINDFDSIDVGGILKNHPTVETINTSIVENAVAIVKENELVPDKNIILDKSRDLSQSITISEGVGIYLYIPRDAQDDKYDYTFTPYIISAPTSNYVASNGIEGASDEWVYTSVFNLKSSAVPRFGDLKITKTLNNFNESLGDQSFVYYVKGVLEKDPEDPTDDEVVIDTVYKIDFTEAEKKTRLIEHIPATAKVTVIEGYPGSSYEPTEDTEMTQTITIVGNEVVGVEFTNTYNGNNISSGIAAENSFEVENGKLHYVEPTPIPTPIPYIER